MSKVSPGLAVSPAQVNGFEKFVELEFNNVLTIQSLAVFARRLHLKKGLL